MKRHPQARQRRRAFLSMELALTLPILMLMLLAVFEFSLLFYARGKVVEASRAATRTATHPGTQFEFVEESALLTLGPVLARNARVEAVQGDYPGDPVVVVVRVPMRDAAPDLLWPIGFGLRNRFLVSETVMQRE
ncbi:MAG: pilus assembly protein [Planctomycetaceae bacterium]|nr:pilus assembly protein [Planctomycetaceae bacterium]